jgi:hypothetical protein
LEFVSWIVRDKTCSGGHLHAMAALGQTGKESHAFVEHRSSRADPIFSFLVSNETSEISSPDFSLALRHLVGSVCRLPDQIEASELLLNCGPRL